MTPATCKVCKMAAVEGCRNLLDPPTGGTILVSQGEDLLSVLCPNMAVVSLKQRLIKLDSQFLKVKRVHWSPLWSEEDRTQENLLIESLHWFTFLSHFKSIIAHKGLSFYPRIVTDMTLLNVYLGKASMQSRLAEQRVEDGDLLISNSLEDLLSSPDLVIIRLGKIVHYNRAAASILREALLLREGIGKPTWLVEPENQSFSPWTRNDYGSSGMACCDDESLSLVNSTFTRITLDPEGEPPRPSFTQEGDEISLPGKRLELPAEVADDPPPTPRKRRTPVPPPPENPPIRRAQSVDAEAEILAQSYKDKKKKRAW